MFITRASRAQVRGVRGVYFCLSSTGDKLCAEMQESGKRRYQTTEERGAPLQGASCVSMGAGAWGRVGTGRRDIKCTSLLSSAIFPLLSLSV